MRRRDFLQKILVGTGSVWLVSACAAPTSPAAPTAAPAAAPTAAATAAAKPASAPTSAPTTAAAAKPTAPPPTTAPTVAAASKPSATTLKMLFNGADDPAFMPDFDAFNRLKDQYGITVDLQRVSGADIAIKSLIANQVDMSMGSLASGILAVGQGQSLKAITSEASAPYFSMVVTNDINSWSDLAGKPVGITATSDGSYWTTVLQLGKAGVDPSSINWVTVRGTPARVDALRAGKIVGAQLQVGGTLAVLKDGGFKVLAQVGKDFPNLLFNAFWTSDSFMRDHADVVQMFVDAEMQGHRDIQDRSKFLAVAKPVIGDQMDDPTLGQAYDLLKDMNIWDPNESRWNADAGNFAAKTLADFQAVEKYVEFSQWGTAQFVDAALKKLGQYQA
jgi:ABC-type nitrate/sulfonate/bicarbonate transport system substrate-binding protein